MGSPSTISESVYLNNGTPGNQPVGITGWTRGVPILGPVPAGLVSLPLEMNAAQTQLSFQIPTGSLCKLYGFFSMAITINVSILQLAGPTTTSGYAFLQNGVLSQQSLAASTPVRLMTPMTTSNDGFYMLDMGLFRMATGSHLMVEFTGNLGLTQQQTIQGSGTIISVSPTDQMILSMSDGGGLSINPGSPATYGLYQMLAPATDLASQANRSVPPPRLSRWKLMYDVLRGRYPGQ